jgi:hypothetical protein
MRRTTPVCTPVEAELPRLARFANPLATYVAAGVLFLLVLLLSMVSVRQNSLLTHLIW